MKYCKNCDLKIDGLQETCLFCGSKLEEIDNDYSSSFPTKKPHNYYIDRVKKIIFFALLILIATSAILEYYIFEDRLYWLFVSFTSIYIYSVVSISLNFFKGPVAKLSNISILTSLEVIGVFIFFDLNVKGICLSFVFPGICILSLIGMLIGYLLTKGKHVHDQLIYIFINALYGIIPLFFVLFELVEVTYLCSISVAFSLLIFIAYFLFSSKESKEELIRRFHI